MGGYISNNQKMLTQARADLDPTWHDSYDRTRQLMQNKWILSKVKEYRSVEQPRLIFTAGAMGSGKTHSLRALASTINLDLENTLIIDPDMFKEMIPEFRRYKIEDPDNAGSRVHMESATLSEIAMTYALSLNLNVVVDGSLKDWKWYSQEFKRIRKTYTTYTTIEIFYVWADWNIVWERVNIRGDVTGRKIKIDILQSVYKSVPISVENLADYVDKIYYVDNDDVPKINCIWTNNRVITQ